MPLTEPIVALSLVNAAFDRVFDAIVRGDIEPGERIREAVLAKELGISRGVLREAMQRLEARKLVRRTPNRGVEVVTLSREDFYELLELRRGLESLAARLAAERMTDAEIAELRALVDAHGKMDAIRTGKEYFQRADADLHVLIARGSKNQRLIQMLAEEIDHQVRRYRFRSSVRPGRTQEALDEHQAIVNAIASRDPAAAEAAMARHLTNSGANWVWVERDYPQKLAKAS